MQVILKSAGVHVEYSLNSENKNAINIKFLCECLGINYNSLHTLMRRDGYCLDKAIQKLLDRKEVLS